MKRVLGIILSIALIFGMILPNMNAVATEAKTLEKVEAKYHGVIVEGMSPDQIDESKVEYICTFSDGDKESFYIYETVLGEEVAPMLNPQDVSSEGTWKAGKQYYTGELCGKTFQLEVDVISKNDSPIKSISAVSTMDLVVDWHTYQGEPILEYCNPKVTITYKDDSKETITYAALKTKFKGVTPTMAIENQSTQGVGKKTVTLDFYGRTCYFDVNVIENPVDHISAVTTKPLIKGYRDIYSIVYDGGLIISVYYKDGTVIKGTPNEFMYLLNDFPSDMIDYNPNKIVIGKNVRTLHFLEKTCEVEYEVIEDTNSVVALEANTKEDAIVYQNTSMNGRTWYSFEHLIDVTLTYKDGSKLTGTINEVNEKLEQTGIRPVFAEAEESCEDWGLGKHEVVVSYMDLEKTVEVEVVENIYEKATISNENDLTVVLEKKNGEKEIYKANKFLLSGTCGESWNIVGYLETDKGTLPVEVKFLGGRNPEYTEISYMVINGVKSSALSGCEWMEQQMITRMYGDVPKVSVNNSVAELKEMSFSDMDYITGTAESMDVWLAISEKQGSVTKEEQQLLDKAADALGAYKTGVVVDLTLYKGNTDEAQKVPEPNGKVSITMAVPESVLASGTDPSTMKIIRIHEGKTEVLNCTYDATSKTVTFETDAFSTYSLAYQGTGIGSATPSPNTGDYNAVIGYMMLCMAMIVVVFAKKKEYN